MSDDKKATGLGAAVGGVAGGVAGGAAAGAAVGGMTGPVGAAVGAAAGALMGARAGKSMAAVDPAAEDSYWRENFIDRSYASRASYDDLGPAYAHGVHSYVRYQGQGRGFDDVGRTLRRTGRGRVARGAVQTACSGRGLSPSAGLRLQPLTSHRAPRSWTARDATAPH